MCKHCGYVGDTGTRGSHVEVGIMALGEQIDTPIEDTLIEIEWDAMVEASK